MLLSALLSYLRICQCFPQALSARQSALTPLDRSVVYGSPPGFTNSGTLYGRGIQLPDSSLLVTSEYYSAEPPLVSFPIYRSTDYGATWSEISRVEDTRRDFGLRYQPALYVLPGPLGNFPAGTIILAGNAIPTDLSETHLELYASRDGGVTWEFISHIADGGRADPTNGQTPVWEPNLLYLDGTLAVYYADQRDPAHGQKTVHQTTTDGVNWGPIVNDALEANYDLRPGMPVVAQLNDGNWILVYEIVGIGVGNADVFYKISDSPYTFGDKAAVLLQADNGAIPKSSPYVTVSRDGRVIVSGGQSNEIFYSDANAAQGSWRVFVPPQERAYSRSLAMITEAGGTKDFLMITGGGWFGSGPNEVVVGIQDPASW